MKSVPNTIAYQDGYNDAVKLFTSDKHINEIKAKAIEDMMETLPPRRMVGDTRVFYRRYCIRKYIDELRGEA